MKLIKVSMRLRFVRVLIIQNPGEVTRLFCLVGAVGLEPTNPSLVRRSFAVAGRRLTSPGEPASWVDHRWTSPCVAWCLSPLAPSLAPGNFVSLANECHHPARQEPRRVS